MVCEFYWEDEGNFILQIIELYSLKYRYHDNYILFKNLHPFKLAFRFPDLRMLLREMLHVRQQHDCRWPLRHTKFTVLKRLFCYEIRT
jgi:hypothetical protein